MFFRTDNLEILSMLNSLAAVSAMPSFILSDLLIKITCFFPLISSKIFLSFSSISDEPSSRKITASDSFTRSRLLLIPSFSISSADSEFIPATSVSSTGYPSTKILSLIKSRVVPGIGEVMDLSSRRRELKSDDFPTFALPTITTLNPLSRTSLNLNPDIILFNPAIEDSSSGVNSILSSD